jgi:hypothetical protein
MTRLSPFKHTTLDHKTLSCNYDQVKAHDGDFYFDNRKGVVGAVVGRPRAIPEEELQEAVDRLNAGELIDGEDVRREMMPNVPSRTVRNSLSIILHPCAERQGFARIT